MDPESLYNLCFICKIVNLFSLDFFIFLLNGQFGAKVMLVGD